MKVKRQWEKVIKGSLDVYVGAKYCERARAKRLMKLLEAQGHRITCDWTGHTKGDAESLALYATEDVKGVQRCNVAIFIMERPHKYKGCFVEMGIALGKGRKVIIIGHAGDSCLFTNHKNVKIIGNMGYFLSQTLKHWLKGSLYTRIPYQPIPEPLPFDPTEGCDTPDSERYAPIIEQTTEPVNCTFDLGGVTSTSGNEPVSVPDKLEPQKWGNEP